jgi:hypothetical protein
MTDLETEWEKWTKLIIYESIGFMIQRDYKSSFDKMQ